MSKTRHDRGEERCGGNAVNDQVTPPSNSIGLVFRFEGEGAHAAGWRNSCERRGIQTQTTLGNYGFPSERGRRLRRTAPVDRWKWLIGTLHVNRLEPGDRGSKVCRELAAMVYGVAYRDVQVGNCESFRKPIQSTGVARSSPDNRSSCDIRRWTFSAYQSATSPHVRTESADTSRRMENNPATLPQRRSGPMYKSPTTWPSGYRGPIQITGNG